MRVVLTGGPGAGKTAVIELVRRELCSHVIVLPEAAGILFTGGFPRGGTDRQRQVAQVAIFHVARQLEAWAEASYPDASILLCDRGTIDGSAYWRGDPAEFWRAVGSDPATELAHYAAVVHVRTPGPEAYRASAIRVESAEEAARIDERIEVVWRPHPRRTLVPATRHFVDKAAQAILAIRAEVPDCCAPFPEAFRELR